MLNFLADHASATLVPPAVQIVSRAKEIEHEEVEAHLADEGAEDVLMFKMSEDESYLLAINEAFFRSMDAERTVNHDHAKLAHLEGKNNQLFNELLGESNEEDKMTWCRSTTNDNEVNPSHPPTWAWT